MCPLTIKKHKVWSSNPTPHEVQLEDQKPMKNSRMSSRRRKNRNANKRHKKRQNKEKGKENLKIEKLKTPPNTLNANSPP
jgi:hypothetical protein